jgi:RNA polymerase sigma-70 factor (ECF subfamily)
MRIMTSTPNGTPDPSRAHTEQAGEGEPSRLDAAPGGLGSAHLEECRAWARDLRAALDTLLPLQRETLLLAFVHQRTQREIADILGVPVSSVGAQLARGLTRLAAALAAGEP